MTEPRKLSDRLDEMTGRFASGGIVPSRPVLVEVDDAAEMIEARRLADSAGRWERLAPRRFLAADLEHFTNGTGTALRRWVDVEASAGRNLVLLGPVGSGKTHAAWAVLSALHRRGERWAGATAVELLESRRPERTPIETTGDYLLIDDVGAESPTPWALEQLGSIINCRWEDIAATIVTSNLDPERLADHLGERAWSRLAGGALVLAITGADRRFG